ncbi:hypothetical protein I317_00538 [Kwoniella heveanensis CBS 569]|uniref:DUF985 domain-containing protein n=1 Tax=Kwoniella heveanensis BCC8398 TaxID=1296120 RepID=A0A1B9GYC9_9TREE|nr:hypothetical protein I316_02511 [Kwoniella heveanensis BCC8398]OCF45636.1 hypothetical protein I317_00538 [Kwoniella heveanensis CBS 569]
MTTVAPPYPYLNTNTELINAHKLEKHFEGGYFAQTVLLESSLPSASVSASASASKTESAHVPKSAALGGREQVASGPGAELLQGASSDSVSGSGSASDATSSDKKTDATQIYYLLTPDSYRGRMHMNLHSTFHIHHAGRALYTLIRPPSPSSGESTPSIHRVIVGPNVTQGEVTQLFVPGGWWKASEIPEEDLLLLDAPDAEKAGLKERIGCLISEVVVPGWNPDQHQFIDEDKLKAMWGGNPGWEQYKKYITAPEGLEYPDK